MISVNSGTRNFTYIFRSQMSTQGKRSPNLMGELTNFLIKYCIVYFHWDVTMAVPGASIEYCMMFPLWNTICILSKAKFVHRWNPKRSSRFFIRISKMFLSLQHISMYVSQYIFLIQTHVLLAHSSNGEVYQIHLQGFGRLASTTKDPCRSCHSVILNPETYSWKVNCLPLTYMPA